MTVASSKPPASTKAYFLTQRCSRATQGLRRVLDTSNLTVDRGHS